MIVTQGHLLDGRLAYGQPAQGYRTGIEPVLLAASVPAMPGQRVLEAGTGAGAGLLCLAARVPDVRGLGVELDPDMAALARGNLRANGLAAIEVATGDITAGVPGCFDHAFANPPWHDPASTSSPDPRRRRAKQASAGLLAAWIDAMARALRPGGTLTLILPATQAARTEAAMRAAGLAGLALTRLLPKAGRPPKLILVGALAGNAADQAPADLILHEDDGRFTHAADAVLRGGAALSLYSPGSCVRPPTSAPGPGRQC